ncbi:MAG: hypothetical protein JSV27_12130 [Candidatus Bathyarchaeota archaeon]|nr:MAG: hypothetical protein JSV27_12130 [Candidatus Bathyarchaeota archaeon]
MALSKETKWVLLPEELVNRVSEIALKNGVSLSHFVSEALEQAIRVNGMGSSLEDAADVFDIHKVMRASGAIQIPRSDFSNMIKENYEKDREKLLEDWHTAGRWYGEYLRAIFRDEALGYLEKVLLFSWNLNEIEVVEGHYTVRIHFISFTMSLEFTELLISFISGLMTILGYNVEDVDSVRGLATVTYKMNVGV